MQPRLNPYKAEPGAFKAMMTLQEYVNESGLEPMLLELVKMRASQINGCAFCLHMHARDALKLGESGDRLHLLPAWREAPLFTARERAALAWTEALTRLADGGVPDAVFAAARTQFTEAELVKLTLCIIAINGWNRINVAFSIPPQVSAQD